MLGLAGEPPAVIDRRGQALDGRIDAFQPVGVARQPPVLTEQREDLAGIVGFGTALAARSMRQQTADRGVGKRKSPAF